MRHRDPRQRKGGPISGGIRGIAGGIGFVSESISAYKSKQHAKAEADRDQQVEGESRTLENAPSTSYPIPDDPPPSYSEVPREVPRQDTDPDAKDIKQEQPLDGADEHEDTLEEEWALDDAQEEIDEETVYKQTSETKEKPQDSFLHKHPVPDVTTLGSLSLPVVLPQRRPKERSRGFIRAYAPILENCGIDQATWLEFLDLFQNSSAANPWVNAVNLAALAGLAVPSGFGILVSYAVRQMTKVAIEAQSRGRTNSFLQTMNDRFFQPRGLFCLVMTYDPESTHKVDQINITERIASRGHDHTGFSGFQDRFRSSDGTTHRDIEIPEVAPLIFPTLDESTAQSGKEGAKKGKMAESMAFVANYKDKRATALYAGEHPSSKLNVPQDQFKSRYADPNNPASSGSLISLVSGGKLVPNPGSRGMITGLVSVAGQAIRGEPQGSGWDKTRAQGQGNQEHEMYEDRYSRRYRGRGIIRSRREGRGGSTPTPIGTIRKVLKQKVLYLMVVQMPSEEEMARAPATIGSS